MWQSLTHYRRNCDHFPQCVRLHREHIVIASSRWDGSSRIRVPGLPWQRRKTISDTIYHKDRQMMVVVEGRRLLCCTCKQIGHIAKICHQKTLKKAETLLHELPEVDTTKETSEAKNPSSTEDGWTQETRRRRKSDTPKKAEDTLRDPKPITPVAKEPAPVTKDRTAPSSSQWSKRPHHPLSQETQTTPTPAPTNIVSPWHKKPKPARTSL